MGYSAIVSIRCDYPGCEVADDYLDSDNVDYRYLPEDWARVRLRMDVQHEDHHDEAALSSLLCPAHSTGVKELLWPEQELAPRSEP